MREKMVRCEEKPEAGDKHYQLGNHFRQKEDYKQAIHYYRLAAEEGNKAAHNKLGFCYQMGLGSGGVPDHASAFLHYKSAAEHGNPIATTNLATLYRKGLGVKKDAKKAFELYESAARSGYIKAWEHLGICYGRGLGVGQDPKEANKWFAKYDEAKKLIANQLDKLGHFSQSGPQNSSSSMGSLSGGVLPSISEDERISQSLS